MATYKNRYKDEIIFVEISENKIQMTGYNNEWCRFGWENDYTDAYKKYIETCNSFQEPNMNFLIDDSSTNCVRPLNNDEFIEALKFNEQFYIFYKFVKSDKSKYYMVDPSGGPYITIGSDLQMFFKDGKKRIVQHIEPLDDQVIFTISKIKLKR